MSPLRWALVVLLVVATALFAVGVTVERSKSDSHVDAAAAETGATPEGAPDESGEADEGDAGGGHSESAAGETKSEDERVLGVDLESTPLIVLAVLAGLGLAALMASRFGRSQRFLLVVAAIALVSAVLDVREVFHQFDESRTGVALIAGSVAVMHLAAAAVSGRLAQRADVHPS